ncbi:hypothetical protein QBZ16_002311 [Prototheca wickerhamii]|uniref:Uncharacterized protein n=1 Tax=Prototheca wickerhamii TaxID=3111 RepID=A0AAD9ILP4_PROWI|nr:hypothetical protein QBZ16_002311 [Prototheca wickerhamii]
MRSTLLRGESVLWIDTTNSFSAGRLLDIVSGLRPDLTARIELEGLLERVEVVALTDMHALLAVLAALTRPEGRPAGRLRRGLVVCDSLTAVAAPLVGPARGHRGLALVEAAGLVLKAAAAAQAPALGEAWRSAPHVRLRLRHAREDPGASADDLRPLLASVLASTCGPACVQDVAWHVTLAGARALT